MKASFRAVATALIIAFALFTTNTTFANDNAAEPLSATPAIIVIEVLPTPTPDYPPAPALEQHYREYEWDAETIDAVASIYWAECDNAAEKLAITKLLFNRAAHGSPFADTVLGAAKQKGEFNHGHISNRNRELARVNMNKVQTQIDGDWAGVNVPSTALYRGWDNGMMFMRDADGNEVWRSKE